jgi:hypothetical protein
MPRAKTKDPAPKIVKRHVLADKWKIPESLKQSLMEHARWPHLTVTDW